MKLKAIVIDDNPFVRESIIKTIDWECIGCAVIGEASDGIEGKNIICQKSPDIIITDIRMPGLDGLELAKIVKTILPHSKIIAITGYQDFEYAQKAVKLGIFDFILKPIKNEELFEVIKSAIKEIYLERSRKEEHEIILKKSSKFEKQYKESIPQLREKKVFDIVNGKIAKEQDLKADMSELGVRFERFTITCLRSKHIDGLEFKEFYRKIGKVISDFKSNTGDEIVDFKINEDIFFVIFFNKTISANGALKKINIFCHNLENMAKANNRKYFIIISSLYSDLSELRQAYIDLCEALKIDFFRSDSKVVYSDRASTRKLFGKYSILYDLEEFYTAIENSDDIEVTNKLDDLINKITNYSNGNIFVAKGLLAEICITAQRYYYKSSRNEKGLNKSIDEILTEIDTSENMLQAVNLIKDYIKTLVNFLKGNRKKYSQIISSVIDYINNYYTNEISLESIAEKFAVNPSYLSRSLKKETGRNFTDILTETRINAAKNLLKIPQNRVNEVGESVGYRDYSYFYQVFKKIVGITPSEYKRTSKKI